jgi:hypothetical protein
VRLAPATAVLVAVAALPLAVIGEAIAQAAPAPAATPAVPATSGPAPAPVGELKSLGRDRYQIGRIVVDKKARRFTVPGRVHVLGKPLEYFATSPGGMKEYETLLEVDASGSEFNLACILLGLERDPTQGQYWQFSQEPLRGPRVEIRVAWQDGGKRREVSAAEALLDPKDPTKPESVEWVYMGSLLNPTDGLFAADVTGTLIGFVHDANSIIESVHGLGIGAYGSVSGNPAKLPPAGAPVELIVAIPRGAPRQAKP